MPPFDGDAAWVWSGDEGPTGGGRFATAYFRRPFEAPPDATLEAHVSADSRYVLSLDGEVLGHGPAKGDVSHQFYDSYEVDVDAGEHVLGAFVISYAPVWDGPTARMTATSAFACDGAVTGDGERVPIHTGDGWQAAADGAYAHPARPGRDALAGPDERLDGRAYPHGWATTAFDPGADGHDWGPADTLETACRRDDDDGWHALPYRLVERSIPHLERTPERFATAFGAGGPGIDAGAAAALAAGDGDVTVPAGETASFVLDAGAVTTGYPRLSVAGGRGGTVELTYGEALHVDGEKSVHRDTERGAVVGHGDAYVAGGGAETYRPTAWRAFRYVRVDVDASEADGELTVADLDYEFTAYPFEERATFEGSADVDRLWDAAWRTVRLCAHETFEDCPYYEQLQYAGDTQPVMRFAGYVAGDWDLARQAVRHFHWSRDDRGITKSRYPSRTPQRIPSWSLLWVLIVRDLWWYAGDAATAAGVLDGVDDTLTWFDGQTRADGLLDDLPFWKVVDWVPEWDNGVPPGGRGGVSAVINGQYATALRAAARLHRAVGEDATAGRYAVRADRVVDALEATCWDADRALFTDRPGGDAASDLANAWGILSGAATGDRADRIAARLGADDDRPGTTLYGRFYVLRAAEAAGTYDRDAPRLLAEYEDILEGTDLTTLPERYPQGGSHCHAWSSTPLYEYLGGVCGIEPAAPGFERVRVTPAPLDFERAAGTVPTPRGEVGVEFERDGRDLAATVRTPDGVGGEVVLPDGTQGSIPAGDGELRL